MTPRIKVIINGKVVVDDHQLTTIDLKQTIADANAAAQRFYRRYGFHKIGEADDSPVPLDILEKDIR